MEYWSMKSDATTNEILSRLDAMEARLDEVVSMQRALLEVLRTGLVATIEEGAPDER